MDVGSSALSEPQAFARASNRRDLAELVAGYALILAVIWTPRPWQRLLFYVAALFLTAVLWRSFIGWKAMGFGAANLARSFWIVGVALLAAALAMFIAARMHTLDLPDGVWAFIHRYLGYAIWSVGQQILLQDYFLARLHRLLHSPLFAALAAAAIFSLAHIPNPILTTATLVWGFAACLLFLRYRNLYPLALAHAILGITIAMTLPGPVTHNMRAGLGYITYPAHRMHHRSH